MPTIEQNDQAEYQTRDEKSLPSKPASNRSTAETNQAKQTKKVAVKRKTARKKAAKKAVGLTDSAKKKTSQTSRKAVQREESTSSKMETKQVEQPKKVAVKKKTTRKKAAKTAADRMDSAKTEEPHTRRKEIQKEDSASSKMDTKQVDQPGRVAVKKKTTRKRAAKTAGVGVGSAKKKVSQTRRKEIPPERASGTDQGAAPVTASEAGKAPAAEQTQPAKPAADPVRPAAAPPPSQPQTRGGTGLMGFWIKVGAAAFVIVAGVIGIYAFFSEDEASSGPEAKQAAASAQGGNASVADSVAADTGTARGVVFPLATEQSTMTNLQPSGGYNNVPGAPPAGTNAANEPIAEPAISGRVTPRGTPAADQALANQRNAVPPTPQSGRFYNEPAEYRPELYRPLTPEPDPAPASQPAAASQTPPASSAPVPSYYPPPGGYAYPPAPHYGGYGGYYPY